MRKQPTTTYRIKQLLRGERPQERSATAARRLLQVVSAWGPSTELDVSLGSTGRSGNSATFTIIGVTPRSWAEDLSWAFAGVADLEPCAVRDLPAPAYVGELRAARDFAPIPFLGDPEHPDLRDIAIAEFQRQRTLRELTPWPQATYADLGELLGLNLADRSTRLDLVLRYRLSAASVIEEEMAKESLHNSWDDAWGSAHVYLGTPVRVRAFVGSNQGPLPARVHAIIRQWGAFLDLVPLNGDEVGAAWSGEPLDLSGHTMPAGAALAAVRIPVAGTLPFPGMRAAEPPVKLLPLDPVPAKPRQPVRLGRARTAAATWADVSVGMRDLTQHMFIQGASGSGKSTLLAALATGIQRAGGSYTFLDPEGSTVDTVLRRTTAEHADAVRVIRHGDPALNVPINLLAAKPEKLERMVALFAEMIQQAQDPKREGMVGPRWIRYFTLIAMNAVALLGSSATLVSVAKIAGDTNRVRALAKATKDSHPEISHALMSEYGNLSDKESADMASWGASKFQELLSSEPIRWILGSGPDPIDVAAAMDSGTSLLIDLAGHELGQTAARAIGASYLLKHWAALGERERKEHFHVILVDEAHLFSYGPLPKLLAEARKFGVGVVVATQHLGQLTGELADALESNTGTFVSLRTGLQSAQRASTKLMHWPAADLVRLPNLIAAATLSRDGIVTAPFSLQVDFHERVRRLERQGHVGARIAEQIAARSHDELARRYEGITPISDADLARRLQRQLGAPSELDAWLAQRKRPATQPAPAAPAHEPDPSRL